MKRLLLTASMLSVLTFGCGHTLMQPATATAEEPAAADEARDGDVDEAKTAESAAAPAAPRTALRQPGDFITYRFSGSYRSSPVLLTYRVVGRDESTIVMDVTLETDGRTRHYRVHMLDAAGVSDEILSVARIEGDQEHPVEVEAYEALMAETVPPIDENEARIEERGAEVQVGERSLPCVRSSYRVLAAGKPATMTVLENASFAWGDLGGEIDSADGRLIYKAEIVEFGSSVPTGPSAVAAHAEDDFDYDDLDLE